MFTENWHPDCIAVYSDDLNEYGENKIIATASRHVIGSIQYEEIKIEIHGHRCGPNDNIAEARSICLDFITKRLK